MIHQKKLLAVLVGLACSTVAAQSNINPIMGKPNTCGAFKIAFINGIDTERDAAEENLKRITTAYGNAHQEHLISYVLAYNQTRGFPTDFKEASLQALSTYAGATWADYYNAVQSAIYTLGMPKTLATAIAKKVDEWYALTKPSQYSDQDLADILADLKYATQWSPGVRMVIVSHSQGNEYATLVFKQLVASGVPASSIGAVGVAVPDFSVPTGNTYVTSSNDFVTDATRLVLAILPANVTIPYNSLDPLGHNFIKIYMANNTARGMVVTGIKNEFATLKTPIKPSLSFDNTFTGVSTWANCTHEPYPSGPPWTPPPPTKRIPEPCGANSWPHPPGWGEPVIGYYPTPGNSAWTWRPGSPGENQGLASANVTACVALAKGYWETYKATNGAAVPGSPGNCGTGMYGDGNSQQAGRYRNLTSGDGTTTTVRSGKDDWYLYGTTTVSIAPVCRN